jgi:hypothetical protein
MTESVWGWILASTTTLQKWKKMTASPRSRATMKKGTGRYEIANTYKIPYSNMN